MPKNEKYQMNFNVNLRNLCNSYINDNSNSASSEAKVYDDIESYCKEHGLTVFSRIAFKKWLSGAAMPDTEYVCLICEFFGCDANYLFNTNHFDYEAGLNQPFSKVDSYIYETYGIDRKTLDFFKIYKDCGINSVDDYDKPHLSSNDKESFSALFNELIHKSPWAICNLLQIINAEQLGLSEYGFAETYDEISTYENYPGIEGYLTNGTDIDVALVVLSIRLKQLLKNPNYIPNPTNMIETYDPKLLHASAVDDYISSLLANRLKNLNTQIESLSEYITKEPI